MVKNTTLIYSLIILLISLTVNATTAEYSTDNTTWTSFETINETAKTACTTKLNADTTYYIRTKNATTAYKYDTITTNPGGFMSDTIAILLIAGTMIYFFVYRLHRIAGAILYIILSLGFLYTATTPTSKITQVIGATLMLATSIILTVYALLQSFKEK